MSMGLEIRNLSVRLGGTEILSGVDLTATMGRVTGLIGPNGAGKSTLMRATLGLVQLSTGTVKFNQRDLLAMSRRDRARIAAFVEQTGGTEARLSAREAVMLGRIPFQTVWQSAPSAVDRAAVADALHAVGMHDLADRLYHTLSGGEQQRVQVARALAQQPELLILDEPTNHLDIQAQLLTLDLLRQRAAAGSTILLALHDLNLAAAFCDTLVVVNGGKVVASGTPDQVLTPSLLHAVYGVTASILRHPATSRPLITYDLPG
jgi:iron complex transport system ATP-binding protein